MQSLVTLWLNALGRQNSTQDSEVQGSNPDQNMFPPKKYFDQRGPTRALETEENKVKSSLSPLDQQTGRY